MTFIVADRVQETTNSPGTGTATLLGAVSGYQSFSTGVGINNTTFYVIADQLGTNWEVGLGALNSTGTVLTRTTVYSSSNGGSTVNFATGTQYVWCDFPASKALTTFSAGTTGLTPNTATSGAITLAGTLATGNGGTGITSFGTGVQTALGQNVTGSGGIALATSPSFTTPNLGTPSAATLTNANGLPVATGISGLGTGVATALAVNVGSAGSFVVNGGALGTPSSGTVTNLTGTASININGTVGATTPTTGAFTTISASGVITSTLATGTAPFTVASTTTVANLSATNSVNTGITAVTSGTTNYLTFVTATSGNLPQLVNSSITANAVTGALQAPQLLANNGLILNATTLVSSYVIPAGYNAHTVGPFIVPSGLTVTVTSGQRWLVQ